MGEFQKYKRGAYHWVHISKSIRRRHLFTLARYQMVLEVIADWSGKKVADLGSGDGALSSLIVEKGADVTCIEPSSTGLSLAKEKLAVHGKRVTFISNSGEVPPGTFDIVVCADVIEHVSDTFSLLNEMHSLVRKDGVAIVTTPVRLYEKPADVEHVHEFWPHEFRAMVQEVFDVEEQRLGIPLERLAIYNCELGVFFRRPLVRWWYNAVSIFAGSNYLLFPPNSVHRTPMQQLIVGRIRSAQGKPADSC